MMTDEKIQMLMQVIFHKYKSLTCPDFSFVNEAISSKPYEALLKEIKKKFDIEEITDPNEDVSFRYVLSDTQNQWILELSMLGEYAVILRLSQERVAVLVTQPVYDKERSIISLLNKYQFEILSKHLLEYPIDLNLYNTDSGSVFLYQALFSDTEIFPWAE